MRGLFALIFPPPHPPACRQMREVTPQEHFTGTDLFPWALLSYTLAVGFNPFVQE